MEIENKFSRDDCKLKFVCVNVGWGGFSTYVESMLKEKQTQFSWALTSSSTLHTTCFFFFYLFPIVDFFFFRYSDTFGVCMVFYFLILK